MKKAVIATGGKQYLVSEGESLEVELLDTEEKKVTFEPLLVIDDKDVRVGTPTVKDAKVTAEVVAPEVKGDKVTSIRFRPKKRIHTVRGHRQRHAAIKITAIV